MKQAADCSPENSFRKNKIVSFCGNMKQTITMISFNLWLESKKYTGNCSKYDLYSTGHRNLGLKDFCQTPRPGLNQDR